MDSIARLSQILHDSAELCVFTGAGISTPSGIPDFRSAEGLYSQSSGRAVTPERIISHSYFLAHPREFYEFYRTKMLYPEAKPNYAHLCFAELEKSGKSVSIVTQNIDGLHSAAGSSRVFELHGSVHRNYCMSCGKKYDLDGFLSSFGEDGIPHCACGGVIRPEVVLYEEALDEGVINGAVSAIGSADTLVIIGTSLVVQPAASFVRVFGGRELVLINKSPTPYDSAATLTLCGDCAEILKKALG